MRKQLFIGLKNINKGCLDFYINIFIKKINCLINITGDSLLDINFMHLFTPNIKSTNIFSSFSEIQKILYKIIKTIYPFLNNVRNNVSEIILKQSIA